MGPKFWTWVKKAWSIARKDVLSEWRTRQAVVSSLAFAFISLVLISLCSGDLSRQPRPAIGLLWVILFFSSVNALVRAFSKEEDARTADFLRLLSDPLVLYCGKALFNLMLLSAIAVPTLLLFLVLLDFKRPDLIGLLAGLMAPLPGLSALGTVLGAMLARAHSRWAVFSVAAFPLFLPSLTASIDVMSLSLVPGSSVPSAPLIGLTAFSLGIWIIGALLFDSVW